MCYNLPIFSMRRRLNKDMVGNRARKGGAGATLRTTRTYAGQLTLPSEGKAPNCNLVAANSNE